jgi:hypothetical protein
MKRMAIAGSFLLGAAFALANCSSSDNGGGDGTGGSSAGTGGSKATGGSGAGTGGSGSGTGGSGSGTGGSGAGTGGSGSGTGGSGSGTGGSGNGGSDGDAAGTGGSAGDAAATETGGGSEAGGGGDDTMSFFVTSVAAGNGGNLGGLEGADAKCKELATKVSVALGAKTWHAYLSTATVNAKDRIGTGPWRNQKGEIIANSVAQLHDQGMNGMLNATWPIGAGGSAKALDELGKPVPTQPQQHDILTGTKEDGTVDGTNTCGNWTAMTGMSTVGHCNRMGGGRPPSWNSAHTSGCAPGTAAGSVGAGGGRGSIYCFAVN